MLVTSLVTPAVVILAQGHNFNKFSRSHIPKIKASRLEVSD